ncbi:Fms-interacting domain containing protein [Russula decolorans]|jgi:THO complex subunit 5
MMQSPDAEEVILALQQLATNSSPNDDPASIHIRAGALFARLKALNRDANAAARAHKQITTDARHDMDQTHLRLQNLLYEKRHLEREIEKCRQFASVYQDIQMYSIEQFIELSPTEAHSEDVLSDEHQLTLNRLGFELVERQRLDRKVKELAQEKEEVLKTSKSQAATTDSVKMQIEALLKTASEIGKKVEELVPAITNIPDETPMPG